MQLGQHLHGWMRWVMTVSFALPVLTLPTLAAGDDPDPSPGPAAVSALPVFETNPYDTGEARALFESGVAATREGDWQRAEAYFRQSLRLTARRSTTYNLARALYELQRPTECLRTLDTLETLAISPEGDAHAEHSAKLRQKAAASVARLRLTVTPAWAAVSIDGEPQTASGPVFQLELDPGVHRLKITAEGYLPYTTQLSLPRGGAEELAPQLLVRAPRDVGNDRQVPKARDRTAAEPSSPWPAYVAFGMGGALALGGIGFGVAAHQADVDFERECPRLRDCSSELASTQTRAIDHALVADILYASSLLAVGVGGGLLLWNQTDAASGEPSASLQLLVTPVLTGAVLSHAY